MLWKKGNDSTSVDYHNMLKKCNDKMFLNKSHWWCASRLHTISRLNSRYKHNDKLLILVGNISRIYGLSTLKFRLRDCRILRYEVFIENGYLGYYSSSSDFAGAIDKNPHNTFRKYQCFNAFDHPNKLQKYVYYRKMYHWAVKDS